MAGNSKQAVHHDRMPHSPAVSAEFTYCANRATPDAGTGLRCDSHKVEARQTAPYKAYYTACGGTKANEAAASAETLDSVTLAQAQNDAYNFVRAQASQPGATYTDIVNQLDRNRDYGIKTWGEARWNAYAEAALAAAYQYFNPTVPEPLLPYKDYVTYGMRALGDKSDPLYTQPTYDEVYKYVMGTDLSPEDKKTLGNYLLAYYEID